MKKIEAPVTTTCYHLVPQLLVTRPLRPKMWIAKTSPRDVLLLKTHTSQKQPTNFQGGGGASAPLSLLLDTPPLPPTLNLETLTLTWVDWWVRCCGHRPICMG